MKIFKIFVCFVVAAIILSCVNNRLKINVSSIKEEVKIVRYDEELFALVSNPGQQQVDALHAKYPDFTDLFTYRIIRIGDISDSTGSFMIYNFLTDSTILQSKKMVERKFSDISGLKKDLVNAFKHYRHYFPGKPLPVIYTCISGFNEPVFITDTIIGISLDKYLGADCVYYSLLDIPKYKQRHMLPAMIPVDVVRLWGLGEFEISEKATTLLDHIIHEGKLMYYTEAMLPATADTLLTGYTSEQLKWCKMNETQMWNYLIENKLLFSTKQMDIVRYINDGPTTNGFPQESPARTGIWLGRQIIRSYMKHNPGVSLPQLMADNDYQQILNAAVYTP